MTKKPRNATRQTMQRRPHSRGNTDFSRRENSPNTGISNQNHGSRGETRAIARPRRPDGGGRRRGCRHSTTARSPCDAQPHTPACAHSLISGPEEELLYAEFGRAVYDRPTEARHTPTTTYS